MFKRREPLSAMQNVQQFFWPTMGWVRSFHYIKYRLIRVADSTHKIALGLAFGLAVSFTPLLGTHFMQAGILAYIFRGNIFSAMIGTFVGNPWTFPFFWWAGFSAGSFLFGVFGIEGAGELPNDMTLSILMDTAWNDPLVLFLPWMMGGYMLCIISVPLSYFIFYKMVTAAKLARKKAKLRRLQRVESEVTGQVIMPKKHRKKE